MQVSTDSLFSDEPAIRRLCSDWQLNPTAEQIRVHLAMAARTLQPLEPDILGAANWLGILHAKVLDNPSIDFNNQLAALDDKSRLLHRLSYKHVPSIAEHLESSQSPLYAIDAKTRILPDVAGLDPQFRAALRHKIAHQLLPEQPPAGADPTWHGNRRNLQQLILHDNPHRFLTWPVIINSMFMDDTAVAGPELETLKAQPDFATRWLPAIREDGIGAPSRTPLLAGSSNNLIHHAYNLLQLELFSDVRIHHLTSILEFGGGYGSTARLAFRLGFRGTYVIFDLPEFSALQEFYLGQLGFPVGKDIHCVTNHVQLERLIPAPDLFLATWSLSETPLEFRKAFLPRLLASRRILMAYQESFGSADNLQYFPELAKQLSESSIQDYAIPHLAGNHYFIATAQSAGFAP